ncbi:hypothetical protein A4U53_031295 [Rhizobium ruizarguesonis]|uniref:Uncharacterized protein n=1 Tax=Rhizobium ruizarguesonis TaxID=2081791 RepID=A0ACD5EMP5_9HYPH
MAKETSADFVSNPAWRHYAARLFPILPQSVTKPEKSRIMPGHIDPRIRRILCHRSLRQSLWLITGPIESLWQRFHSMVRIRTGT